MNTKRCAGVPEGRRRRPDGQCIDWDGLSWPALTLTRAFKLKNHHRPILGFRSGAAGATTLNLLKKDQLGERIVMWRVEIPEIGLVSMFEEA